MKPSVETTDTETKFTRTDIQNMLEPEILSLLAVNGVVQKGPHIRRTLRALLRITTRQALKVGCHPAVLVALLVEALNAEVSDAQKPAEVPGKPVAQA